MKYKKRVTAYDAQESQLLQQSTAFVEFLTRRGALPDPEIRSEGARKADQSLAQKAYHNTEILMEQYRSILWVLECIPGELCAELQIATHNVDELIERLELESVLENKRVENQLNTMMKTRILLDRVNDALDVLRRKPGNGEMLYKLIYEAYIAPKCKDSLTLIEEMHVSSRTYYRMRTEAISIISIRLWSAPSKDIDDWLEILTIMDSRNR